MTHHTDPAAERMARFEEACRSAGVRVTHQRMEIFREVAATSEHPDAETVHRAVSSRLPRVSLDTVYRSLWLFRDLGLITTLGPSRDRTRFDANLDHHHHFVCDRCGLTRDFYSEALDRLRFPELAAALGDVQTTHVEAHGVCRACKAQREDMDNETGRENKNL